MSVKWQFEDYWKGQAKTLVYQYSGAAQDFVVPDTVESIRAILRGAAGGGEAIDTVAEGGYVVCDIPVTGGETLRIRVGGNGSRVTPGKPGASGAFNGGGDGGDTTVASGHTGGYAGGGATDIRQNGDDLASRVAVAGAGGGSAGEGISHPGGAGGANVGQTGYSSKGPAPAYSNHYYGGLGGSQTAGGAHGAGGGSNGALGVGGVGHGSALANGSGGGGGGLYGGGGGGSAGASKDGAGGGGGSNGIADGVDLITSGQGGRKLDPADPFVSVEYTEQTDVYVWEINPNEGGSPSIQKNVTMSQVIGPNRLNILQEGQSQAPVISFAGVILSQTQYEAMELWFDKRILIKLTDDLGRAFFGVFTQWSPQRQRRAHTPWYHTYQAQFTVSSYINASGTAVYGRAT